MNTHVPCRIVSHGAIFMMHALSRRKCMPFPFHVLLCTGGMYMLMSGDKEAGQQKVKRLILSRGSRLSKVREGNAASSCFVMRNFGCWEVMSVDIGTVNGAGSENTFEGSIEWVVGNRLIQRLMSSCRPSSQGPQEPASPATV